MCVCVCACVHRGMHFMLCMHVHACVMCMGMYYVCVCEHFYNNIVIYNLSLITFNFQVNAFLMKLVSMSQYAWNPNSEYKAAGSDFVNFPEFVTVVTECFETLNLTADFTDGLILELYDFMIKGIHKKGFLEKKGHVQKELDQEVLHVLQNYNIEIL